MEKKNFFRLLLAIATIIFSLTGCLDEHFNGGDSPTPNPDPDPNPDGKDKVTLVEGSADIKHEWKYANLLVSDVVTSMATLEHDNGETVKEEEINQMLPFEIKWTQPAEMTRGSKVFNLQEKNFGQSTLTATENNDNITLKTFEQDFSFLFDGMEFKFETNYQTATSKYEGIDLANCVLDSIVYVDQKAETLERYYVGERPFLKSKVTFTFDVCRHHTHNNEKHTDQLKPYIIVSAPESVNPGEDIFNGAVIIAGTEKLFFNRKVDANTDIYTSQVDVWEYWTVSGKKRVTYSTELEVKRWIDDAKEPWKVPNIEFGYPNFKELGNNTSGDYVKENVSDYVFQKTTSDWVATWSYANNYQIGVHGSSEKAWKTYLGAKIVEMPSDIQEFYYDKYTYNNYTEKVIDGTTYLSYPSIIYFNALYNGDNYKLSQNQEFLVEKGGNEPPAPKDSIISEKIIYELENNNEKWISKIIFRRKYSITGERDSVATQTLSRSTKVDGNKQFVRLNNTLNLTKTLDPVKISENTTTDKTTGHVISTIVNRHGFDFDFFTFNIEETYQTAYTMYKGERLNFLAPVPSVVLSGQKPKDMGIIIAGDGTKYNRTEYTLSFKETYGNFNAMYYPLIDIDVLDNSKPETDDITSWTYDRERDGYISNIIYHITRKLSGTKDSTATANLSHAENMSKAQEYFCQDNGLRLADASATVRTSEETKNGITYVTTITTNRFKYDISNIDGNDYYDEVTTTDVTAYTTFQGTRIDFLAPETSKVTYSGSTASNKGQVIKNGKKYNLTTYTHTYKVTYDGKTTTLTNTVDLYVEVGNDDVTNWTFDRERDGINSKVILHITRKLSGSKDSTIIATLAHSRSVAPAQKFFCKDNSLSLSDATPTVRSSEETKNGVTYVTTTTTNRFSYDITDVNGSKYVDEVTTTDVTAYMYFQGTRIDFLAPETSTITYSGSTPADKGQVTQNGEKYNLTTYTHSYKELYDGKTETFTNTVDLYVKPAEVVRTDYKALNEGLEKISNTQWKSYFTLYEKFSDGKETNTYKEQILNVSVQAPEKRTLKMNSSEFTYTSLTPKSVSSSTRIGGENITVTTLKAPYDLVYTNKENETVSSEFIFISETAVYKDGEIKIPFKSATWEMIQPNGYSAPLQGLVGDYNRYNAEFNISGQYNGVNYTSTALVDVDVLAPQDPTIDPEWGDIDIEKNTKYGTVCISWEQIGGSFKPIHSGTIITTKGIISFMNGYKQFTAMDTNLITDKVGNAYNGAALFPSYIDVDGSGANISWSYLDVQNGSVLTDVHSSKMTVEGGFDKERPFLATGGEANVYQITKNGERTMVIVTFNGEEMFREVF